MRQVWSRRTAEPVNPAAPPLQQAVSYLLKLKHACRKQRCVYVNAPFVLIQLCAVQACLLIDCSNHSPAIQLHLLKQNNVFTQMLKIVFVTIYRTARPCVYMVRITTTDCIHDTSLLV